MRKLHLTLITGKRFEDPIHNAKSGRDWSSLSPPLSCTRRKIIFNANKCPKLKLQDEVEPLKFFSDNLYSEIILNLEKNYNWEELDKTELKAYENFQLINVTIRNC